MIFDLLQRYNFAKTIVIDEGFDEEINWQLNLSFDEIDESTFLRELAWVILSSGMKNEIVERKFLPISDCFFNWESAKKISENSEECFKNATLVFNHQLKISAIIEAAKVINNMCFTKIKELIEERPLTYLQKFKFIGPITAYHLAKNIGLNFAKPDRHLQRIAELHNYSDVQMFCEDVSKYSGDSVPVVDVVFWRFATIEPNYTNVLMSLNTYPKL